MALVGTWWQLCWMQDKAEDVLFVVSVTQFSLLIILNRNRIWPVTGIDYISICFNNLSTGGYLAWSLIQISRECRGSGKTKAVIHLQFQPSYFFSWAPHSVSSSCLDLELVTHASHQWVRPRSGASWSLGISRDHFIYRVISPADAVPLLYFTYGVTRSNYP